MCEIRGGTKLQNCHNFSYLLAMAVTMLAIDPVYSLAMLSKCLRIRAIAKPPMDEKSIATNKSHLTLVSIAVEHVVSLKSSYTSPLAW